MLFGKRHSTESTNLKLKTNFRFKNWQFTLTKKSGNIDKGLNSLTELIIYWYKPQPIVDPDSGEKQFIHKFQGDVWQTSYAYLIKKLGCSKETIRRRIVKLEELGYIKREFKDILVNGQEYNNRLFIHLTNKFFKSVTGFNKVSYDGEDKIFIDSKAFIPLSSKYTTDEIADDTYTKNAMLPSPQKKVVLNIDIYNTIFKNRSSKSNFVKNKFKQQEIEPKTPADDSSVADLTTEKNTNTISASPEPNQSNDCDDDNSLTVVAPVQIPSSSAPSTLLKDLATKIINKVRGYRRKPMGEFYPISEDDAEELRKQSGREFNLNYINQLLQKLSKAKPDHGFYTKALFIKYMTMTLSCELRQAVNVNNEGFKFKAVGEGSMEAQEKYLQEIEYSSDTSCMGQLQRKIASVFDSDIAYKILSNHSFALSGSANGEFEIRQITSKSRVEITANEQRILLEQVRAVYGAHIEKINNVSAITSSPASHSAGSQSSEVIVAKSSHLGVALGDPNSIWHKVSLKLLDHYGEAIHSSWFSRLSAQEDKLHKKLILKAPTNFISSWINDKYGYLIGDLLKEYKYSCVIC